MILCIYIYICSIGFRCQADVSALLEAASFADPKWKDRAIDMRSRLGMSPEYRPWTSEVPMKGLPLTARTIESLDIGWGARPVEDRTFPWYCDLNPDIGRTPYGPKICALLTTSRIYDYRRRQLVLPPEAMLLHGMPGKSFVYPASLTSSSLYHMVGESMNSISIGSVLVAIFLNPLAPWWGQERDSETLG
jgi:hypothetical protein